MDFHFGGQHTSVSEDEARVFGLWSRRLDLHGFTQLVGCDLLHQPPPASALQSQGLLSFSLCSVAKGISLLSLTSLPNSFHHPKQSDSRPTPCLPPLSPQSPRIRVIPSLFIRVMSASQPVRDPANKREPSRQSASCVSPMAAAPASKHTHRSILASRRRGDSRGIQATGSCSSTARSYALLASCWRAVGGKSPRRYPSSAQKGSSRGGGGFLLFSLRFDSLPSLALPPLLLLSHTFRLSLDLPPLSSAHGSLPLFLPASHPAFITASLHTRSNSNLPYTHPTHLWRCILNKYAQEREIEREQEREFGRMSSWN